MSTDPKEFEFPVFQRRWGVRDKLHFVKTGTGWSISFMSGPIETGPDGLVERDPESGIHRLLGAEAISYPEDLSEHLAWVWERASEAELEPALKALADWVSVCEEKSPQGGVFKGLKPTYMDG